MAGHSAYEVAGAVVLKGDAGVAVAVGSYGLCDCAGGVVRLRHFLHVFIRLVVGEQQHIAHLEDLALQPLGVVHVQLPAFAAAHRPCGCLSPLQKHK